MAAVGYHNLCWCTGLCIGVEYGLEFVWVGYGRVGCGYCTVEVYIGNHYRYLADNVLSFGWKMVGGTGVENWGCKFGDMKWKHMVDGEGDNGW